MEAARHLHVVDADTGEKLDGCPTCARKSDEIAGLQRDVRGWAFRYAELSRDKLAEAKESEFWPVAVRVFDHWRAVTNHPRCAWTLDRFQLIEPFLKNKNYGKTVDEREALCKRAIDGYAFDCFVTTRRNGSKKRHDGLELIFRDAAHFEEGANRAPKAEAA